MTDPSNRSVRPVAIATCAYLILALGFAIVRVNLEFLFYIVVMLILIGCILMVDRAIGLGMPVLWGLSLWGLAHMAGGLVVVPAGWPVESDSRVLYTLWLIPDRLKYDHVVHAYGFALTTFVCWHGLCSVIRRRGGIATPTLGLLMLAVAAALGFGALNEVVEFAATLVMSNTNVGGYQNTGWDLVSNLLGALVAAALIWRSAKRVKDPASDRTEVSSRARRT